MADKPAHRASDAEREAAADQLRAAAAEGRLDPDELDERVGQVYGARTRGELTTLTEDVPEPSGEPAPPESAWTSQAMRRQVACFIVPNLIVNVVWLATGADYWWPKWVLLGTGIALIVTVVNLVLGIEDEEQKKEPRLPRPPAPPGLPRP